MFDFTMTGNLELDKSSLDTLINSPTGELGRWMKRRAKIFIMLSQSQVGKSSGSLAKSIRVLLHNRTSYGQRMWIGSNSDHAIYVHEGTRPHEIAARDNGIMRFSGGGRVVYTHKVNHPGTRPNKYLSNNLWVFRI